MSVVVRTDEEIMELQEAVAGAFDDGLPGSEIVVDVLEWLTNKDAPQPGL